MRPPAPILLLLHLLVLLLLGLLGRGRGRGHAPRCRATKETPSTSSAGSRILTQVARAQGRRGGSRRYRYPPNPALPPCLHIGLFICRHVHASVSADEKSFAELPHKSLLQLGCLVHREGSELARGAPSICVDVHLPLPREGASVDSSLLLCLSVRLRHSLEVELVISVPHSHLHFLHGLLSLLLNEGSPAPLELFADVFGVGFPAELSGALPLVILPHPKNGRFFWV
mmetsp:Transcript_33900/g.67147  ORF Transcript_33900/g.67147 Transcript_33900/m.67147 type:complete len:228 (-) Transcript_33900:321-1004(-)